MARLCIKCLLMIAALAAAIPSAEASVTVEIGSQAILLDHGQAALVTVVIACPANTEVLEAFLYIIQDGKQSQFAAISAKCTGKERHDIARVQASEVLFHRGAANATAFVLVIDPTTGATESGQVVGAIEIR